jgi:UDP:flavonoid glycosyltransferase YjiC (YdhE family)
VWKASAIRVLFSSTTGYGHLHPLVPLATAFADDGHEVAFATAAALEDHVASFGFATLAVGPDPDEIEARFADQRVLLDALPIPERRPRGFVSRFAMVDAPARLPGLLSTVESFAPDLLVYEPCELAAPIVAAVHDVPTVHHAFGRMVPPRLYERAEPEVARLWRDAGVEPRPLCGTFDGTYVDICPPSFQVPDVPVLARVEPLRPEFPARADEVEPEWLTELDERPLVYMTLGTIFNDVGFFRRLLAALADVDCQVVATIGRKNDPDALAPLPANARVERYVSQSFVLPHASVVVAHGGSGSILATFARGLPSLLVPRGADQFENAERCTELGAGITLLPDEVTAAAVRDAVEMLLTGPSYRRGSRVLAAEIAAMPEPGEVAARLAT